MQLQAKVLILEVQHNTTHDESNKLTKIHLTWGATSFSHILRSTYMHNYKITIITWETKKRNFKINNLLHIKEIKCTEIRAAVTALCSVPEHISPHDRPHPSIVPQLNQSPRLRTQPPPPRRRLPRLGCAARASCSSKNMSPASAWPPPSCSAPTYTGSAPTARKPRRR